MIADLLAVQSDEGLPEDLPDEAALHADSCSDMTCTFTYITHINLFYFCYLLRISMSYIRILGVSDKVDAVMKILITGIAVAFISLKITFPLLISSYFLLPVFGGEMPRSHSGLVSPV